MANDDVWAGTEADDSAPKGFGSAGDGISVNEAFSLDRVARYGLAVVKEQPALAFVTGFVLLLCQFGPTVLTLPLTLWGASGDASDGVNAVASVLRLLLSAVAFPVQQLVLAGSILAYARYLASDVLDWSLVYTSVVPAVRSFAYQMLIGVVFAVAAVAALIPIGVAIGVGVAIEQTWVGVAVAVAIGLVALVGFAYVGLGLTLGIYSAVLDDRWPHEAVVEAWSAARGSRLTLLVTSAVLGLATVVAVFSVYCLVGLVLLPLVSALWQAGFTAAWLLYRRPASEIETWAFFQRHARP